MNNTAKKLCTLICVSSLLFSTIGCGSQQTQTGTIPESTETVASLKLFVWDGVASGKPYVNTIRVNDIKDGIFTQDKIAELEAE